MKTKLLIVLVFVSGVAAAQSGYVPRNVREALIATAASGTTTVPAGSVPTLNNGWPRSGALYVDSVGGGRGLHYYLSGSFRRVADSTELADTAAAIRASITGGGGGSGDGIGAVYNGYGLLKSNDSTLAFNHALRDSIIGLIPAQVNLIAGTNVTITGTYPNKTINAAGDPNWVFLSDYGTPNDGLSDTAAIKAAVATGKNVYVTPGEWLWDGYRCTLNTNQIIRGYGPTSIIRFTQDIVDVFFIPQGTHHVQIDYIKFIGKGRGSAPGGEVFTLSNAIFIQGDSNRVQYCDFKAVKGSGIHLWVASGTMYANEVSYSRFDSCGVGIYALNNAEYSLFLANQAYYCRWGFYERCAGNNTWDAFTSNYNDLGFGLLGSSGCNGDHGSVSNARINHNTAALDIRQCNNEYVFNNVKFYNGTIAIGSLDTAKRVLFDNCVLSGNTFTVTKALSCQFSGGTFGTTAVTIVGSDDDQYFTFCNVQNSPYSGTPCGGSASLTNPMTTAGDMIIGGISGSPERAGVGSDGDIWTVVSGSPAWASPAGGGNVSNTGTPADNQLAVFTGPTVIEGTSGLTYNGTTFGVTGAGTISTTLTTPKVIGGTGTTDDLELQSTSGVGATGAEIRFKGGNNGATTFMTINNAGEFGIGVAATAGFKWFMKSNAAGDGTVYHLWRNSSDQNVFQMSDLGSTRIGNQSLTTSVNNFYNNNMIGGAGTPTARAHLIAGTATASTAPLKFTSGVNLTTAEAGAMEFDGSNFYLSRSTTRKRIPLTNNAGPTGGQLPVGNGTDYTVANITSPNSTIDVVYNNPNINIDIPTTVLDGVDYSPTPTDGTNTTGVTILTATYYRTKTRVVVYGLANAPVSAGSTLSNFEITLPVASAMTVATDLTGAGGTNVATAIGSVICVANETTDRAIIQFYSTGTSDHNVYFNFSYKIK